LTEKRSDLKGGIFAYAGAGYGPMGEFISGWAYWLSAWLGNLAFATMLMSAIGTFIPVFKGGSNLPSIIVAIIFCWALTFLVNNGVEGASVMGSRAKSLKEAQQASMLGFVLLLVFYMMISILLYGSLTRA
jgi:arginine:ornithine antiporter/lysine permease